MTGLISQAVRDSLNWDSIERCIIGSALALRATNKKALQAIKDGVALTEVTPIDPTLLDKAVEIGYRPVANGNEILATLTIEAKLYYSQSELLLSGMNLVQNLVPYSFLPLSDFVTSPPSLVLDPLPPEPPDEIENLEQFFLYYVNLLGEYTYPDIKYFGSQLFDSATPPYFSVTVNLPLDYRVYCRTQNYLEASKRVVLILSSDNVSSGTINYLYWLDPVNTVNNLKVLNVAVGASCWVKTQSAMYSKIATLPDGVTVDNDLFVASTADAYFWKKGGTGQGTGTGSTLAAAEIRDLLAGLTGTNRLDATAIKNLPSAGTQGLSAYEVAIANGFVGTESEWLTSLEGTDGDPGLSAYEVAIADGFVGTESEWLISLEGTDGTGTPGLSAYQVALANGFVGTESEWLLSLKGDPGASGEVWNNTAVITADYQILDRDRVRIDTTAGVINLTCPISGEFKIVDIAAISTTTGFGLNSAFLLPNTGQTVRGASSFELDRAGLSQQFQKINNNWVNVNG
jgi:hypothetical protein